MPPKRKREAIKPPPEEDWTSHKALLREMYSRLSLEELRKQMETKYNFIASKNQFERKFKEWNFRKNLSSEEWPCVLNKKQKRDQEGKESRISLNGIVIPVGRIKKEEGRYTLTKLKEISSVEPAPPTPEGVVIFTPDSSEVAGLKNISITVNNLPTLVFMDLLSNLGEMNGVSIPRRRSTESIGFLSDIPTLTSNYFQDSGISNTFNTGTIFTDAPSFSDNRIAMMRQLKVFAGHKEDKNHQLTSSFGQDGFLEFLSQIVHFACNNMLNYTEQDLVLNSLLSQRAASYLRRVFATKSPAIEACMDNLCSAAVERQNREAFKQLYHAYPNEKLCSRRQEQMLLRAVRLGLVDIIKALLATGIDVNAQLSTTNWWGRKRFQTFLGAAPTAEIAQILLEARADVNTASYDRSHNQIESPIHRALKYQKFDLVKMFLDCGAKFDPNHRDCTSGTPLQYAILAGDMCFLELLRNMGAEFGETEVERAAESGDARIVSFVVATPSAQKTLRNKNTAWSPLGIAAREGYSDVIQILLQAGANVNGRGDFYGSISPLEYAVKSGQTEVVNLLLKHNVDVNAPYNKESMYGNALEAAECLGYQDIYESLLEAGAVIPVKPPSWKSVMFNITNPRTLLDAYNDLLSTTDDFYHESVGRIFLSRFLEICGDQVNMQGPSALEIAISMSELQIAQKLIAKGAAIDIPVPEYGSVLQLALWKFSGDVTSTHTEFIRLLLKHNANVNAPATERYGTALEIAACNTNVECVQILLSAGAKVNVSPGEDCRPPIHAAIRSMDLKNEKSVEIIHILLDRGADLNAISEGNNHGSKNGTALQTAVLHYPQNNLDFLSRLLSYGADINAPAMASEGRTALQAAIEGWAWDEEAPENLELVTFLLKNGADVNAPPAEWRGITALQGAAIGGHLKIAHMLLERNADPNATRSINDGRTALEGAAEHGRLDMVQLLLNAGAVPTQGAIEFAELHHHFVIANMLRNEIKNREIGEAGKVEEFKHAEIHEQIQWEDSMMFQHEEWPPEPGHIFEMDGHYHTNNIHGYVQGGDSMMFQYDEWFLEQGHMFGMDGQYDTEDIYSTY